MNFIDTPSSTAPDKSVESKKIQTITTTTTTLISNGTKITSNVQCNSVYQPLIVGSVINGGTFNFTFN